MRSSYKTTVNSLLKSGEVFTVSFLQSLFHFYGPFMKIQQVTHIQDWQGSNCCRGQGNWEVTPASRLCQRHKTTGGSTWFPHQVLQVYGMDNTVVENRLSSFKRWQVVFLSILLKGGCLPSDSCPPSLPGAEVMQRQSRLTHLENS